MKQGVLLPGYANFAQKKFRERALKVINNLKVRMLKMGFKADGFDRDKLLATLAAALGKPCPYCGEKIRVSTMSPDHAMPISKGGEPWTVQVTCARCNRRKGMMDDTEYRTLLACINTFCPETQAYLYQVLAAGAAFPMMRRGLLGMKAKLAAVQGPK